MSKDKLDILEKLHKDKLNKMSQKGRDFKKQCEESEKYIKEMQEMELKRELKYNTAITIIIGAFLALCVILAVNSIVHRRQAYKANISTKQNNNKTVVSKNKVEKKEDKKDVANKKDNNVNKKEQDKKDQVQYYEKIGNSLNIEADRQNLIKKALILTGDKYQGINIKYMVAILRANGVNLPTKIDRTDTLIKELEKLGWKKNTNFKDLKKGDLVFTIDSVGIKGVPSHCYIFMSWENAKMENAYVVDALLAKQNVTYHKRAITVQTETTDKFQFFMRK